MSILVQGDNYKSGVQVLSQPDYYRHSWTYCPGARSEKSTITGWFESGMVLLEVVCCDYGGDQFLVFSAESSSGCGVTCTSENAAQRVHHSMS